MLLPLVGGELRAPLSGRNQSKEPSECCLYCSKELEGKSGNNPSGLNSRDEGKDARKSETYRKVCIYQ